MPVSKFPPETGSMRLTMPGGRAGSTSPVDPNDPLPWLRLFPPAVNFHGIEANTVYTAEVTVRNADSRIHTVKMIKPTTKKFFLVADAFKSVKLAPGMTAKFEVAFAADSQNDFWDKIVIQTEVGDAELPLAAYAPAPECRAEGDLDMGVIAQGCSVTRELTLTNHGSSPGAYRCDYDRTLGPALRVEPAVGSVPPASGSTPGVAKVRVTCAPDAPGASTEQLEVFFDGKAAPFHFFVDHTCVPHTLELLVDDGTGAGGAGGDPKRLTEMPFGAVLYGDAVTATCVLFNNGPNQTTFAMDVTNEEDLQGTVHAMYRGEPGPGGSSRCGELDDGTLIVEPRSGILKPYERRRISVTVAPKLATSTKGFKSVSRKIDGDAKSLACLGVITFSGVPKARCLLPITAKAVTGALDVQPASLDFGSVACHDVGDHIVMIKNMSKEAPVDYVIDRSTFFKPQPASGKILPGQSVSVVVRYEPKNLGTHVEDLTVKAMATSGKVMAERTVRVKGFSDFVTEKPPLPGGTMAVPEDFERPRKFVSAEEVRKATIARSRAGRKHLNPIPTSLQRNTGRYTDDTLDRRFSETLTLQQATARETHRTGYVDYIRTNRRRSTKAARVNPVDPTSLGLVDRSGLVDNGPPLPDPVEPLWLNPDVPEGRLRPQHRAQRLAEDDELLKLGVVSNFKRMPSTAKEMKECSRVLIPKELAKLKIGPSMLDFGEVSVLSDNLKFFTVTNENDQAVLVHVDTAGQLELKNSTPTSQVVPPGKTAHFGIALCVDRVDRNFKTTVGYSINSNRTTSYAFDVLADVVPVQLDLNASALKFRFAPENWEDTVTETLVVTNPNMYAAEYQWRVPPGCAYSVHPSRGAVPGNGMQPVRVTWSPSWTVGSPLSEENFATLVMDVVGGSTSRAVRCTADAGEPKLRFKETVVDFETIAAGLVATRYCTLKNVGRFDAVYRLDENFKAKHPQFSCDPDFGSIRPGASQRLTVTFESPYPGAHKVNMQMNLRGGKPVKIPVLTSVIVPVVHCKQQALNFGDTFRMEITKRPVTLVNTSDIDAELTCDLRQYPDFDLEISPEAWSPEYYEDVPVYALETDPGTGGSLYKIHVAGKQELTFRMVFHPTDTARKVSFAMPFLLEGVVDQPTPAEKLCKTVTAESKEPRVLLGTSLVDFAHKILLREGMRKVPHTREFTITNNDPASGPESLHWAFGKPVALDADEASVIDDGSPKPYDLVHTFQFEPKFGILKRGESVTVKCSFSPMLATKFEGKVPVYLDGAAKTKNAHLRFGVAGLGAHPRIKFDEREVRLAPTPLGVVTTRRLWLINEGFDNMGISCKLPADKLAVPLQIEWPEGQMIGIAKQRLPVDVSFESKKPLSFTATIEFLDEDGKRFPIPVSGIADNCTLTTEQFLAANDGCLTMDGADVNRPVMLPRQARYMAPPMAQLDQGADNASLARWLNACTPEGPVRDIPGDFIRTKGLLLVEIIKFWTGREIVATVEKHGLNKRQHALWLCERFDKIITYLKGTGALLNGVYPEFLVDEQDYHRLLRDKMAKVQSGEWSVVDGDRLQHWIALYEDRDRFRDVSASAWRAVLMQTIRIFVLNRITPKQFSTVPNCGDLAVNSATDASIAGSNVFSVAESIILKWMTHHRARVFPGAARVCDFDDDLRDGTVLYGLLVSHWPNLSQFSQDMKFVPETREDIVANHEVVLDMLRYVQLSYDDVTADELARSSPSERLLFCLFLYNHLPQLVPRTVIDFPTLLGQKVVKNIELTNPAMTPISYSVRLEGNPDFTVEATTVRMEKRSSAQLAVSCTPTSSLPERCRLILAAVKEESQVNGSTLVFDLNPVVKSSEPIRKIDFKAKCYEYTEQIIELQNPYPGDCEFGIVCTNYTADEVEAMAAAKEAEQMELHSAAYTGRTPRTSRRSQKSIRELMGKPPDPALGKIDPSLYPDPFGVDRRSVRLKKGEKVKLRVSFLPFIMGPHTAHLSFEDHRFGKFVYELAGGAEHPQPMSEHKAEVDIKPQMSNIVVSFINNPLELAKRTFLEKHPLAKVKDQADRIRKAEPWPQSVVYALEVVSSHMEIFGKPRLPLVKTPRAGKKTVTTGADGQKVEQFIPGENTVSLNLNLRNAGVYPGKVVLKSQFDVRVVDLEYRCGLTGDAAQLEFECAAGQSITQNIPLVNSGMKPMSVTANFAGQREYFAGYGRDMVVDGKKKADFPLTFRPARPGTFLAKLVLKTGGESISYALKGVANEPLAQGHVVIGADARGRTRHRFTVPNVFGAEREAAYEVSSDLNFVGGDPQCVVRPNATSTYDMGVAPTCSGVFHGSITFTAPDGSFCWWTLEVRVAPPPVEDTLDLTVPVREALTTQITLANPSAAPATFRIYREGHGVLGADTMRIAARSEKTYDLVYSPMLTGPTEGSVRFVSAQLGEFWYALRLDALDATAAVVPEMRSEVGGARGSTVLDIENPLDEEVLVALSCPDNPRNFIVAPPSVTVPPFGVGKFRVTYAPSSLNQLETGTIVATNEEAGTWTWSVSGRGAEPTKLPATDIFVTLGQTGSGSVSFQNPFHEPIYVDVAIETDEDAGVWEDILKKRQGVHVDGFQVVPIPFKFSPRAMTRHEATMVITTESAGDTLTWRYPLIGIAEAVPKGDHFRIEGKARRRCEMGLEVFLHGLKVDVPIEHYTFEVVVPESEKHHLRKALVIKPLMASLTPKTRSLRFAVAFRPKRAMSCSIDFLVNKQSGGRWRFPIHLEAIEPEIDGTVVVEANVNEKAEAVFSLANPDPEACAFTAYFTPDSPAEFSVKPNVGTMLPGKSPETPLKPGADRGVAVETADGGPGVDLRIRYRPKEYGGDRVGKLVVTTKENTWVFEVVGTMPEYNVPVVTTKLNTRIDPSVDEALKVAQRRRRPGTIVRENLRAENYTSRRLLSKTPGHEITPKDLMDTTRSQFN